MQEILGLNSTFFEVEVNRPVPNSIEIPIENPYGIEIGRKEVPIKVSERSISFKDILKDLHFVSGEKGEMVTFKGRGRGPDWGFPSGEHVGWQIVRRHAAGTIIKKF